MRKTWTLVAALLASSSFNSAVSAQDAFKQPSPAAPAEIIGPPLVAWSVLQKPRPIPEPLPPPDNRTDQSQAGQPADSQPQQPSAQTFTGTIAKDSGKYVLKVSENTAYQIDDQDKARDYEGKQVRVAGRLDAKNNVLHVASIELVS
jgi:hypothetical protein